MTLLALSVACRGMLPGFKERRQMWAQGAAPRLEDGVQQPAAPRPRARHALQLPRLEVFQVANEKEYY